MSSFRQSLVQKLALRGVDEEAIADSLAHVIKGERVKKVYGVDGRGDLKLSGVEVVVTPKDAAQGALLYDALRGGDLGLAPQEVRRSHAIGDLHRRFAPPVDSRIIPVNNFLTPAPAPTPVIAPEPEPEPEPFAESLVHIAFQDNPEEGEF